VSNLAVRASGGIELLAQLERAGAITSTSLVLPPETTWEQYEALAGMLGQLHRTAGWLIGDLLNFGEKVYGETYVQAAAATGLAEQTLMNYASVCSRIPRARRRPSLPFSVHAEVAYLEPDEQERWLSEAEQEGWTRSELRLAMKGEQPQDPEPEVEPEVLPLAGEMSYCPNCGAPLDGYVPGGYVPATSDS
jgi:hypothetical protein